METGPRLKVSSDRPVKPGIEPANPGIKASGLSTTPRRLHDRHVCSEKKQDQHARSFVQVRFEKTV